MVKNKDYQLGLYEKAMPSDYTWLDRLSLAKELGFDYVEISIDETDERLARLNNLKEISTIQLAMAKTNMPIRSMCLSGHRKYPLGSEDDKTRDKGLQIFYDAVDLADALGIRTIQLAGYDVYYDEGNENTKQRFIEYLKKGVQYAASKQVMCGFETMETEFMNTIHKTMEYVELVNNPFCQIYPDLGNLKNASLTHGDLYQDIEKGRGHIVAAHLKETVPGKFREILFDTGHVDFDKGIKTFWDLGVRSYVCECWYIGQENYKEELKFNYNFLSKKLNKIAKEQT
ncbi:MAG TPA: L-ribulose-5-phosphate 3-epimerase [Erysipelothrix sp.]|nr:L-ribulose-5-phosphate 3-epimerase [Erysipelothrix sp.]